MLGTAYHYNSKEHELIEPECLRWIRRETADPALRNRLFAYRHKIYGTFVVALWLGEPHGFFVDILNLGMSLGHFTRPVAQELRHRLFCPAGAKQVERFISETNSVQQHKLQDESNEYFDRHKRSLKHGT